MVNYRFVQFLFCCGVVGCNVDSPPGSTGGVMAVGASGSCGRGVAIVTSDYRSTNIVVSKLDGTTLSESFVSSAATKPGLALALSGDVDVPFVAPPSQRVVLIDRYGTNVLTWLDFTSADVLAQLPVGTGFESNPQDYLEVDATHALVARAGSNPTPGNQPFDAGGDLLIIDFNKPAIVGRIALPEDDPSLQPNPEALTWLDEEVVVTLGRWSADFSKVGDGRFVGVSPTTNAVEWQVDVTGLTACGRLALSPSGKLAAIACSSQYNATNNQFDPASSDIVVYDATVSPPVELRRLGVAKALESGLQPQLNFATEDTIFALTYGGNRTPGDTAIAVNATTGEITSLASSTEAYAFGGMHCSPGCGDICLLSDAERNRLRRWHVQADGAFEALDDLVLETLIGLPPRSIGSL